MKFATDATPVLRLLPRVSQLANLLFLAAAEVIHLKDVFGWAFDLHDELDGLILLAGHHVVHLAVEREGLAVGGGFAEARVHRRAARIYPEAVVLLLHVVVAG